MMDATQFKTEEDFKKWFFGEKDQGTQINGLMSWRRHQQLVVESLSNLVSLLASEQYTHSDHFLLELLQNADDNDYPDGVTPELKITLERGACTFECNESGFKAENVFAICYAAASTKKRRLTGRTFIGEKGIGFKSIFAVAQSVEIHSGDYHFELHDKEYVIPHLIQGEKQAGSRVVIRFKPQFENLPGEVSERLRRLTEESRHFLIFLQKLEKLTVCDRLRNVNKSVEVLRDHKSQRCIVESESSSIEYFVESFPVEVPIEIVKSRFEEINEPLKREILFAVPLPQDLEKEEDTAGRLFCYLPTQQKTGMPIHIQLDAKTVTNREDIMDAKTTPWNRFMLEKTSEALTWLFVGLSNKSEFSSHLPAYLPSDPDDLTTSNDDLTKTVEVFCEEILGMEWVLDRHGDSRPPEKVRTCPRHFDPFVLNDQYEKHLPRGAVGGETDSGDTTFLNSKWKVYQVVLAKYGVRVLTSLELALMWKIVGVPEDVENGEDTTKRNFLRAVIEYCKSPLFLHSLIYHSESLILDKWKDCPIFPLRTSKGSKWGELEENIILLVTDIQNPTIPEGTIIVDPSFTISPSGGSKQNDDIRDFNSSFRDFLVEKLQVTRKSDATYLEEIIINGMQIVSSISNKATHLALSVKWVELYYRVWRRQKTLQDESAAQWETLLQGIRKCHVPLWRKTPEEVKATVGIGTAILPAHLGGIPGVDVAYREAGATVLDILVEEATDVYWRGQARRRESGIDLGDWGDFLRAAGANAGPKVQERQFTNGSWRFNAAPKGTEYFIDDIKERIPGSDGRGFTIDSINTVTIDAETASVLYRTDIPEALTRALELIWPQVHSATTVVVYNFGSRNSSARVTMPFTLASSQLTGRPFKVRTYDDREARVDDCYLDSAENLVLASGLLPLVKSNLYQSNHAFLTALGVRGDITTESIEKSIREAFEEGRLLHEPKHFSPYLKMAAKLALRGKNDRIRLLHSRIFLDPIRDELVDFRTWKSRGCDGEFDAVTRESLDLAFGDGTTATSPEDLIALLKSIPDLGTASDQITTWFLQVARTLQTEGGGGIIGLLAELVSKGGLRCMGESITESSNLPLIWDKTPLPESTTGLLLPPERPDEASAFMEAAARLGWPSVSRLGIAAITGAPVEIEPKRWRLVNRILEELESVLLKSDRATAHRLANLPFAGGIEPLKANLKPVEVIRLSAKGIDGTFEVPYWPSGSGFLIAAPGGDIVEAIGEIIDSEAHLTISGFIDMIRDKVEVGISEAQDSEPESEDMPSGGFHKEGLLPKANGLSAEDLLLGTDDKTNESSEGDAENGSRPGPTNGEVRKRLCSYVLSASAGNSKKLSESRKSDESDQNSETEQAGVDFLRNFIKDRCGLEIVSVEDENCGYDFELKIGSRTLCIELKTSQAKWRQWEHSLTPNEFKTALEKKADYFLCIVDRVFENSREIYFIQDPAGKVTDFLFDSPWKSAQSKMSDLLSSIKATEGVLDE